MLALAQTGCPYPTQFSEAPDPVNVAPSIDPERTSPYFEQVTVLERQNVTLVVWVNEPNPKDILYVRVIQDLHLSIDPESGLALVTLVDAKIYESDSPAETPTDASIPETMRTKSFETTGSPCPAGSAGTQSILTVCVADRDFEDLEPDKPKDPCVPQGSGYLASYSVVVRCEAEQ